MFPLTTVSYHCKHQVDERGDSKKPGREDAMS